MRGTIFGFKFLERFLPLVFIITVMSFLAYGIGQQVLRQDANEPQIQIAEDLSTQLSAGAPLGDLAQLGTVDISKSLSEFVMVYDASGKQVTSNVTLNGQVPNLPSGIFNYTKQHGEDRFTWQPEAGIRSAVVAVYYTGSDSSASSGFVAVGRSLREVERNESHIAWITFFAWLIAVIGTFFLVLFGAGGDWLLDMAQKMRDRRHQTKYQEYVDQSAQKMEEKSDDPDHEQDQSNS